MRSDTTAISRTAIREADRIRSLLGITHQDVADRAKCSRDHVTRFFTGDRPRANIYRAAVKAIAARRRRLDPTAEVDRFLAVALNGNGKSQPETI